MAAAVWLLSGALLLAAAGLIGLWQRASEARRQLTDIAEASRMSWLDSMLRRSVILHLTDDSSVRGVLVDVFVDGVILAGAELLDLPQGAESVALGGRLFLPRHRIALAQYEGR